MFRPFRFAKPVSVSLQDASKWRSSQGLIFEEKIDGVRASVSQGVMFGRSQPLTLPAEISDGLNNCRIDGELLGGVFYAFDLVTDENGDDLRNLPLFKRKEKLNAIVPMFPSWMRLIPSGANGAEYLEAVLHNGGEGIVAKDLDCRYGFGWFKAKRCETYDVVVTEKQSSGVTVEGGGKVQVGWDAWLEIRIGDVIEISCHSITKTGKYREPVFIRRRTDKTLTGSGLCERNCQIR